MLYYRCKCGEAEAWGSMSPNQCDGCEKCGTTLATNSGGHRVPMPHEFTSTQVVRTDQGTATITRCKFCGLTRDEIEKRRSE